MRGGQPNVPIGEIAHVAKAMKDLGHEIMSEHMIKSSLEADKRKYEVFVHDRDYQWIIKADCGVFEISNPSLGVGAEICDMIYQKKPILCLYKRGLKSKVSAYILGKEDSKFIKTAFECYEYDTVGDAKYAIKKFLEEKFKK